MTERETLKLALEALESCDSDYNWDGDGDEYQVDVYDREKVNKAITAIKKALALVPEEPQPEQICGFAVLMDINGKRVDIRVSTDEFQSTEAQMQEIYQEIGKRIAAEVMPTVFDTAKKDMLFR